MGIIPENFFNPEPVESEHLSESFVNIFRHHDLLYTVGGGTLVTLAAVLVFCIKSYSPACGDITWRLCQTLTLCALRCCFCSFQDNYSSSPLDPRTQRDSTSIPRVTQRIKLVEIRDKSEEQVTDRREEVPSLVGSHVTHIESGSNISRQPVIVSDENRSEEKQFVKVSSKDKKRYPVSTVFECQTPVAEHV